MNTQVRNQHSQANYSFNYSEEGFPKPYDISVAGFWLPCGRTNFFNHTKDRPLLDSNYMELNNIELYDEELNEIGSNLQTTVFRRLSIVLLEKKFTHVYARIPNHRKPYPDESDPDSAVFLCARPSLVNWPGPGENPYGLLLFVNDDGFYLWIAIHQQVDPEEKGKYKKALKAYICKEMVGENFYRHLSGLEPDYIRRRLRENEEYKGNEGDEENEDSQTLLDYRDDKLGILTFFQLNIILEGLFNHAFDERIFFTHNPVSSKIKEFKQQYSLDNFASFITTIVELKKFQQYSTYVDFDIDKHNEDVETYTTDVKKYLEELYCNLNDVETAEKIALTLIKYCLDELQTQLSIMRQFLRTTSAETLQQLNWRIERSRRALLSEMISIMHIRQPLTQVEPPDMIYDDLREATEDQLRGYVMLISSKLPIIKNVQRHIKIVERNIVEKYQGTDKDEDEDKDKGKNKYNYEDKAKEILAQIDAFLDSWYGLFASVEDNVRGLENAIDQARKERQLHEEERIRIEQEAVAEIERMREQSGRAGGTETNQTFSYAENIIALISVSLALLALVIQSVAAPNTITPFSQFIQDLFTFFIEIQTIWDLLIFFIIALGSAIVIYFGYAVIHWVIGKLVGLTEKFRSRFFPYRKRHYYEMDVRLDEPISMKELPGLIEIKTEHDYKGWRIKFSEGEDRPEPLFKQPDRYAYRAEIESRDEGYYKIHAYTEIFWPRARKLLGFPLRRLPIPALKYLKMETFITYEVLYHLPSGEHSFLLRECRLATTHSRMLTTQELQDLKTLFVVNFVNRWFENENNALDPTNEREPLFALTLVNLRHSNGEDRDAIRPAT